MSKQHKEPSAHSEELPQTPRIEQLKMLFNEYIFVLMGVVDRSYQKVARLGAYLFEKLPISEHKKPVAKSLLKKLLLVFSIIFTIFFVFIWLNPLLGFFVTIGMAYAIFYWPDIAFRYREYKKLKENES